MAIPNQSPGFHNTPLTQMLLTHNPHLFSLATSSPFLHSAGLGTLPKSVLSKWLSQDRLYAQSYIGFIGALIARVHLPHAFVKDKSTSLRWKIVKLLSSALENIHRELAFFEDAAERYGLDLEASPGHWKDGVGSGFQAASATRQYEALFRAFGADPSMSLLEGLVVLWATEQVYLSAWRYAASQVRGYSHLTSANGNVRRKRAGSEEQSALAGNNGNGTADTAAATLTEKTEKAATSAEEDSYSTPPLVSPATEWPPPHHPLQSDPPPSTQQMTSPLPEHTASPPPQEHQQRQHPQPIQKMQPDKYTHDLDGGALRREFIPNWTSAEFEKFVQEIADVTDELAEREEAWQRVDVYKAVWEHILEVERRFWPNLEGY